VVEVDPVPIVAEGKDILANICVDVVAERMIKGYINEYLSFGTGQSIQ